NNQVVISKKRTYWEYAAGYDLWVWAGSTAAIFDLGNSDTRYEVASSTNVEDNNWHHVVATYDGSGNQSGMRIYVDGTLSGTGSPATISNTIRNSYNLTFGCDAAVPYTPLNGWLDEVRISNSARSADWFK